jgi:hypothetical protein
LLKRLGEHQQGRGARLVEVITQAGISFRLARTWPGVTRARERQLKAQGGASRRCPICLHQHTTPGRRHDQPARTAPAVPTRGTTPTQAHGFLELNPKFARPVGAAPATQWARVRGREAIELLTPRVTGAWFEENHLPSQHRAHAITRRGVQARVQARQHHRADRAEQQRIAAIAGRTRRRLASAREHPSGRAARERKEHGHER